MKQHKQFVAVLVGRKTGVFNVSRGSTSYRQHITGFAGVRYRYFETHSEAAGWLAENEAERSTQETLPEPIDYKSEIHQNIEGWKKQGKTLYFCFGYAENEIGRGGWRVVRDNGSSIKEWHGGFKKTSKTRMEIYACMMALNYAKKQNSVLLTPAANVLKTLDRNWVDAWKQGGWKKKRGAIPANLDLWKRIHPLQSNKPVKYVLLPDLDELLEYGDPITAIQSWMKFKWQSVTKDFGFLDILGTKSLRVR